MSGKCKAVNYAANARVSILQGQREQQGAETYLEWFLNNGGDARVIDVNGQRYIQVSFASFAELAHTCSLLSCDLHRLWYVLGFFVNNIAAYWVCVQLLVGNEEGGEGTEETQGDESRVEDANAQDSSSSSSEDANGEG